MVKIKIEDVIFWLIILFIIGIAIWMLHGSPMDSSAIIALALAFASSELMIWKKIFSIEKNFNCAESKIDKNITISFMKIKNDFDKNNLMINNKLDIINNKITRRK